MKITYTEYFILVATALSLGYLLGIIYGFKRGLKYAIRILKNHDT